MSETGGPVLEGGGESSESALDALFFVVIALFLGIFTKQALAWTRIPFTALLLVWGVLLGIGNETYTKSWNYVGPGIAVWEDIDPNFFLALLLPLIIYSAAISMHWHTLRRCLFQVLLLAGPGVVIGTALTAVFAKYAFPYNWTWIESLLFGAMLSATDPVAVVALLQEVGAEKELRTVIEGESLFNDGSAYVLFLLFRNALQGQQLTGKSVVSQLCQLSIGGPAVGIAFGLVMVVWLRFIYNQDVVEVTMTIVAALGCFIVANEILGVSGVLAVLCLGIWMAAFGSHHISRQVQFPLQIIWEELEFIANTLIFILAGVIIAGNIYLSQHTPDSPVQIAGQDYGYAILLWVVLLVVRAIIFLVCYPMLKYTGYSISVRKAMVMVWAGLRGAVGLALSLFLLFDGQISDRSFRLLAFFFMGMIAAITIVVQGTTTGLLLRVLGLTRRLAAKRTFLNNVMQQVEQHGDAHAKMVKHSDVLGPPNWKDISSLASLNAKQLLTRYASAQNVKRPFPYWDPSADVELEASHRQITAENKTTQVRLETRARLLRAVQQTYEDVFERAQIAPPHMYQLRKSTNQALDHTDAPLSDWTYLQQNLQVPAWLKLLLRSHGLPFLANISRRQLFQYLQDSASVMVAFHYAHTDAAQSMLHFDLMLQKDQHDLETENSTLAAGTGQPNGQGPEQANCQDPNQSDTGAASHTEAADGRQAVGRETSDGKGEADRSTAAHETAVLNDILEAEFSPADTEKAAERLALQDSTSQGAASRGVGGGTSANDRQSKVAGAVNKSRRGGSTKATGVRPHDTAESVKAKIIQEVIQESKDQLRLVEQHLRALRIAYPEVMASIRTRQVAQEMLLVKEAYIHELKASDTIKVTAIGATAGTCLSGLMDEAEVQEVVHLVERQKKRLHFAGSMLHVQPAQQELRQLTLFQGLSDKDFAKIMSAARMRVFRPASTLRASHDRQGQLVLIVRGAVFLKPADHMQYPTTTMFRNPLLQHRSSPSKLGADPFSGSDQSQTPIQTGLASEKSGMVTTHSKSQAHGQSNGDARGQPASSHMGSSHMQDGLILDAQGCAFGLPGLLQDSDLGVHVTAETLVEACSIPWSTIQGLARANQALEVRLLQSCGAHMAMCHGGQQLQRLSWPRLQNIFRKGKLQNMAQGQVLHDCDLIFLMSGELQVRLGATSNDDGNNGHEGHEVWRAPGSFCASGLEAVCLQRAQVFHLPEALLQLQPQQPHPDKSADRAFDTFPGDRDTDAAKKSQQQPQTFPDGASAADTGRWGKRLHDPSPFLSHDLWAKLGTD